MNDTGPIPLRSSTANHPQSKYRCSTPSAYGDLGYLCPGFHADDMAAHFHSSQANEGDLNAKPALWLGVEET